DSYQVAIAWVSESEKPLAMRSITVDGRWPERKACIASTVSAALRPCSGGTDVSTPLRAGWQPEQELAPGGGTADPIVAGCAQAAPADTSMMAVPIRMRAITVLPKSEERRPRGRRSDGLGE